MKVTFITYRLGLTGGENLIRDHADALGRRGHDVSVVSPRGMALECHGRRFRLIETSPSTYLQKGRLQGYPSAIRHVSAAIPQSDLLVAPAIPTVVPTLWSSHIEKKGKAILLHQDYREMLDERPLDRELLRWAPAGFAHIVADSEFCVSRRNSPGAAMVPTTIVYPWIKPGFRPRAVKRESGLVLYVGQTTLTKGFYDFLRACHIARASVRDLRVLVVCPHGAPELPSWAKAVVRPDDGAVARVQQTVERELADRVVGEGVGDA